MNELTLAELYDTLRSWVLRQHPGAEAECARLRCISPVAAGDEAHRKVLSGFFECPDDTAEARRMLRTLCRQLETPIETVDDEDAEETAPGRFVAEAASLGLKPQFGLPRVLKPNQRKLLVRVCEWADNHASQGRTEPDRIGESATVSPLRLVRSLQEAVPRLKDNAPYRILSALGHDVVVPTPGQKRVFERLGQFNFAPGRDGSDERLDILNQLAHWSALSGDPVRVVGSMVHWFSGDRMPGNGDGGRESAAGVCRKEPDCARCLLAERFCTFFRTGGYAVKRPEKKKSIKDWREEERPRERLAGRGAETLSDAELLAIILRTGQSSRSAVDMARDVLEQFGGLGKLDQASLRELQTFPGIGLAKAVEIKAALELGKRLFTPGTAAGKRFTRSREVFEALKSKVLSERREHFFLLALNAKNEILRLIPISTGNLTQSLVHPREVFREAIREAAAAVILVHNHPSGDPAPSQDDRLITSRLCRAGQLLGISVLDHLIIGSDDYFSFADHDMMNDKSTGGDG